MMPLQQWLKVILPSATTLNKLFKNEKGLKIHFGRFHKDLILKTPGKERSSSYVEELTLNLTPKSKTRDEEIANIIPEKEDTFKCDYCKYPSMEFVTEGKLSIHLSNRHSY